MGKVINELQAFGATGAAVLLLVLTLPLAAVAADKDASPEKGAPEASEPKDADKSKEEAKPDEAPPPDAKAEETPPAAGGIQSAVKLKDILAEGFLIRTTVLVPAEAVTRQIGKVSSDAVLLTLQKETAIAVCYYTLKAYVKEGLTDIASCTAFR
ncbi:MAG: hypothetical protein WBF49_09310 [Methyloceanibacter sp.]|jgi:hypothetical protein|uniref:hypothetical protein n=1 Tax=Methyloceanibacter sp. TaxID=1965321 RepID=UPI003C74CF74